jgi:phosphatidylglycerophosphatase A
VGSLIVVGLFRGFDIAKPFPVGWLDRRLKGGVGIVADDLAAGLLANLTYRAGLWLMT